MHGRMQKKVNMKLMLLRKQGKKIILIYLLKLMLQIDLKIINRE
jgi:hypothetical protein